MERLLTHEIGHALGLDHNPIGIGLNIMAQFDENACQPPSRSAPAGIMLKDRNMLRDYYGPFDPVDITITKPEGGFKIFPSTVAVFEAVLGTRAGVKDSDKTSSLSVTWEVDGREVASGQNVQIDTDEFIPGGQEVSVIVRSSAGEVLGSDSITVEKVTDLMVDDYFIVFPLPCINLAGSADNRCLIRLKESRHVFQCQHGGGIGITHGIVAKDSFSGEEFAVIEPNYYKSPWGSGCTDNTTFDLFYGIWADVSSDRFLLRYTHDVFEHGTWLGRNEVTGLVHKTDPVLESFSIPGSCTIASNESRCDITVSWGGHYFAPSSALYFRRDSSSAWTKVADMGLESGRITLEDIVPFGGGQFAVFQYGTPFRVPNSGPPYFPPYRTLISAPSGRLAGPFTVQANVAAGTTASPLSGLWGNSVADGTGISLTRSSNGSRLLVWLTYTTDGKAIWYMSRPALERDGVFTAPLEKINWKSSSATLQRTVVGQVSYAALTGGRLLFDWELDDGNNDSTGSEILTLSIGGEQPTGLWNEPGAANGRGFVVHAATLGGVKRNFVTALTYSGKGRPRWQFGDAVGQLLFPTTIDMLENRRAVSCSSCQPIVYNLDAQLAGELNVEFNGSPSGWVNIIGLDNGEWIRGSAASPVAFGQITSRSLFFEGAGDK